ncbi:MAG: acetyl-CoA acetyltransferase [Gammaproteobacteria bacterium RIFCSPHIGHO2_12_FULL_41_15]|nr:MAG: acetyl-CoA acetyltransferase [Gammaproteobacteria bacterium RIFCSPHIGHO2_12_FULL_41_15]
MQDPIVIISAVRTPMGHYGGCFKNIPAHQLGASAIRAAIERAPVPSDTVEAVLMGCVLPAGQGQAPARQAALRAGLPIKTSCTTINKMCGSGMKAVMIAHDELQAKSYTVAVAGGMENMSLAPYLIPKARFGYRIGHAEIFDHMMLDGLEDAYDKGKPMGFFAEQCATQYGITRKAMDEFAALSLHRAKKANEDGTFLQEIVAVDGVTQDEHAMHAKPEKMAQLKPAFVKDGSVTAANSSAISDGAAALVLMPRSQAQKYHLTPLATLIGHYSHAQKPSEFTTAPIEAIQGLLKKINWDTTSVDLYEINEAFAVVTLVTMQALQLPIEKVNIHGGACALGHPIGASGARIVVTLLHALRQKKLKRGIASLCIGGGEATALAIEMETT